jgi:hypothetical protein
MTSPKNKIIQFFTVKGLNLALCSDGKVFSFETDFVTAVDAGGARLQTEVIKWRLRPEYMNPQEN